MDLHNRYTALARYIEKGNVTGYLVRDNIVRYEAVMPRNEVEDLALSRQVSNIMGQVYNGKVLLRGSKCKISELPTCTADGKIIKEKKPKKVAMATRIIARITDKRTVIGYKVEVLEEGEVVETRAVSKDTVIQLIRKGFMQNARVQKVSGKDVIRGVNCEIAQLPSYPARSFIKTS
jgi:hypothetical protein